jgi:hypothetical protein
MVDRRVCCCCGEDAGNELVSDEEVDAGIAGRGEFGGGLAGG